MDRNPWTRALVILGVIAVGLYLAGQLWSLASHFADITILFFLAWLLAFILLPIVRFIDGQIRLGRVGAAAIVYLGLVVAIVTLLVLVIPLLIEQLSQLVSQLPTLTTQIPAIVRQLQANLDERGIPLSVGSTTGANAVAQQVTQLGTSLLANSVTIAGGVASGLVNFVIVLVLSFYLVMDGDRFIAEIFVALPERFRGDARLFVQSIDRSFGGFLRGTAIQAAILGIGTAIVMTLGGIGYVLLVSVFAGLVMVVPFIGPFLALVIPLVIAVFSNTSASELLVIAVGLAVLQVIVLNVVAPKVMSRNVGLHPLLVFLALLVGIKEAGLAGAIFGVPVAAVIYASVQILLRRWSVIELVVEPLDPNDAPAAPAVIVLETPVPRTMRVDRLGGHVGRVIGRLFHVRVG